MRKFYVTFGFDYATRPHPLFPLAHPEGWVTIVAADEIQARAFAMMTFGTYWAFIYDYEPSIQMHPLGELAQLQLVVSVPDGNGTYTEWSGNGREGSVPGHRDDESAGRPAALGDRHD